MRYWKKKHRLVNHCSDYMYLVRRHLSGWVRLTLGECIFWVTCLNDKCCQNLVPDTASVQLFISLLKVCNIYMYNKEPVSKTHLYSVSQFQTEGHRKWFEQYSVLFKHNRQESKLVYNYAIMWIAAMLIMSACSTPHGIKPHSVKLKCFLKLNFCL